MSEFNLAVPIVLKHEGFYVNDPTDPGGATNYGVSLRFLVTTGDLDKNGALDGDFDNDGDVDIDDIKNMNPDDAKNIYKFYWWDKYGYAAIDSQEIATKVFDLSVNMGSRQAHKCLQRALRSGSGVVLQDDGLLGIKTFKAVSFCNPSRLICALRSEAAGFYRALIAQKPSFSKYENGWLNRAYS
jgi:lysozyme family protein